MPKWAWKPLNRVNRIVVVYTIFRYHTTPKSQKYLLTCPIASPFTINLTSPLYPIISYYIPIALPIIVPLIYHLITIENGWFTPCKICLPSPHSARGVWTPPRVLWLVLGFESPGRRQVRRKWGVGGSHGFQVLAGISMDFLPILRCSYFYLFLLPTHFDSDTEYLETRESSKQNCLQQYASEGGSWPAWFSHAQPARMPRCYSMLQSCHASHHF